MPAMSIGIAVCRSMDNDTACWWGPQQPYVNVPCLAAVRQMYAEVLLISTRAPACPWHLQQDMQAACKGHQHMGAALHGLRMACGSTRKFSVKRPRRTGHTVEHRRTFAPVVHLCAVKEACQPYPPRALRSAAVCSRSNSPLHACCSNKPSGPALASNGQSRTEGLRAFETRSVGPSYFSMRHSAGCMSFASLSMLFVACKSPLC